MKAETPEIGGSSRASSVRVGPGRDGGPSRSRWRVSPSRAPVDSIAPVTTYRAAIVSGASFEKPASAAVVPITPVATSTATAPMTATGAETRSLASTATRAMTTARVNHACHAKVAGNDTGAANPDLAHSRGRFPWYASVLLLCFMPEVLSDNMSISAVLLI